MPSWRGKTRRAEGRARSGRAGGHGLRRLTLATRISILVSVVALASITVSAAIVLSIVTTDVSSLTRPRSDLATAVASAVAVSYDRTDTLNADELAPVLTLASRAGFSLQVRDPSGRLVASAEPTAASPGGLGQAVEVPVTAGGRSVGTVTLRVGTNVVGRTSRTISRTLFVVIPVTTVLIAVLAAAVAAALSRRLTMPLRRLMSTVASMTSGERNARVRESDAPGELGELSRAFDEMADTLEHEERLRRSLVADVAHELRTPLAILQASTEAMVDGVIEPSPDTLSSVHDETLRLGRFVQDLEVLTSADAAGLSLDRTPVELGGLADEVADSLTPLVEAAGLTLERRLQPVVVLGDAARVHQIVTNLLTNAVKFTPAGGTVSLTVDGDERAGRIVVEDTGPGIPEEEIPHVFERFWRGRSGRGVPGSGVGLSVVHELVAAHGGTVAAASDRGCGARFTVTLPRS